MFSFTITITKEYNTCKQGKAGEHKDVKNGEALHDDIKHSDGIKF